MKTGRSAQNATPSNDFAPDPIPTNVPVARNATFRVTPQTRTFRRVHRRLVFRASFTGVLSLLACCAMLGSIHGVENTELPLLWKFVLLLVMFALIPVAAFLLLGFNDSFRAAIRVKTDLPWALGAAIEDKSGPDSALLVDTYLKVAPRNLDETPGAFLCWGEFCSHLVLPRIQLELAQQIAMTHPGSVQEVLAVTAVTLKG